MCPRSGKSPVVVQCLLSLLSFAFAVPAGAAAALPNSGTWREFHPQPLPGANSPAFYDSRRQQMILFGPAWSLHLSPPESWSRLEIEGSPSSRFRDVDAAYDSTRDRIVAVSVLLDTLYTLPLGGSPAWTRTPLTGGPSFRVGIRVAYDPPRNRMIATGGYDPSTTTYYNDVWELPLSGPPVWTELHPTGPLPPPRLQHTCTYDPVRDRMIVFAGDSDHGLLADTWALELADSLRWVAIPAAAGPDVNRFEHRTFYDAEGDRLIACGGDYTTNSLCVLNLQQPTAWSVHDGLQFPTGCSRILDSVGGRLIVFGGVDTDSWCHFSETWQVRLGDLSTQTLLVSGHPDGPDRSGMATAYDSRRRRIEIDGGQSSCHDEYCCGDLSELHLDGDPFWSGRNSLGRVGHAMVYDSTRDRLLVYGGQDDHGDRTSDLYALDLEKGGAWTTIATSGDAPPAGVTSAFDARSDRMWAWAGGPALWFADLSSGSWSRIDPAGDHPGRGMPVVDPVAGDLLIRDYGSGALWRLNEATSSWEQLAVSGTPPVNGFTLVDPVTHALFVVSDHVSMISLDERVWRILPTTGPWPNFWTAVVLEPSARRIVVFGSQADCEYYGECGGYTGIWELALNEDAPTQALISRATAEWSSGSLLARWETSLAPGRSVGIARWSAEGDWSTVARVLVGPGGAIDYRDEDVEANRRYGYALVIDPEHSAHRDGEIWADPITPIVLALEAPAPNPSDGPLRVSLTLPSPVQAELDLVDLEGRRVLHRVVHAARPGPQSITLSAAETLPPGLYFLRLAQAGRSVSRPVARLR